MTRIVLYTTSYCGYCWAAVRLLDKKGLSYEKYDVSNDTAKRRWLVEATGRRTVPQIFIDGRSIGGHSDLVELDRRGELDRLMAAAPPAATG